MREPLRARAIVYQGPERKEDLSVFAESEVRALESHAAKLEARLEEAVELLKIARDYLPYGGAVDARFRDFLLAQIDK